MAKSAEGMTVHIPSLALIGMFAATLAVGLYSHLVSERVMAAMSTDSQGVLAVVAMDESTGSEALTSALEGAALIAVLTEAQDPGNAGAMIRAADAAGADAVVLVRGSVDATSPKVVRSTAGSLFHLPVVTDAALDDVVAALHGAGMTVLAADARGDLDLFGADSLLEAPTAWLLGNEAHGLSPEALSRADAVVSIPVYGRAESPHRRRRPAPPPPPPPPAPRRPSRSWGSSWRWRNWLCAPVRTPPASSRLRT